MVAVSVESVAADSVTYRYTDVSGAVPAQSYTVQVPSIPPECALLGPVQASELSGAVIAVWIVCWAVSAATRPLRGID